MNIHFRPIARTDIPLLFDIYRHTHLHELNNRGWTARQKQDFLHAQFDTQQREYERTYADDDFLLVLMDNIAIGCLYVGHWKKEIRIIDISLLPQFRNRGVGTKILGDIIVQAGQRQKIVSAYIDKSSPALRLYQRLGFATIADTGVFWHMQWQASPPAVIEERKKRPQHGVPGRKAAP